MEQQIRQILKKVSRRVQLVVLVDKNGLPIMSWDIQSKKMIDPSMETVVAGIGAAVLSLAESTAAIMDQGDLKELIIKKENGTIVLLNAGENAVLVGVLPPKAGIDNALVSLKIVANQIAKLQISPGQSIPKPEPSSDIFVPDID